MICKNCNADISDSSIFCPSCGQKVEAAPAAAPAPAFSSAFHHAGSLDGSDSGIGAPVVEKKPAAPQEDGGLRFSSSFKRKSEARVAHKTDTPHTELPGAMHYENADSRPIPAPGYPAPAVVKEVHIPQENPGIRVPSTFTPDKAAPEKKISTKPVHPGTQAKGRPATKRKTSDVPKKKSAWIYVCAGILALVVILVSAFFITKAQHPWFELNSAGKLSFDYDVWEFYHFYNTHSGIEIPKEYDGTIKKISPNDSLQYHSLRYEGSLEEFLAEHPWAIQMMHDHGYGTVKCRDYTFSYSKSGQGLFTLYPYLHGTEAIHVVRGCYSVCREQGKDDILFERMEQVYRWLDTGIYEYSWEDFYGRTYYDEVEITLD